MDGDMSTRTRQSISEKKKKIDHMKATTQSSSDATDFLGVDSTPLDPSDDLFDVKSELTQVSANWKDIGIALRLSPDTLDRIQAGNSGDPIACLTSMVTEWLKRNYNVKKFGEPSWQRLVEVVGHPAGGANMALAREIGRRHMAGGPPHPSTTITNHPSPPRPSLEPAVVISSPPHLLPQAHSAASAHQELSKAADFARENRQVITAKFADFQTKVCNKLFQKGVNTKEFRLFVRNQFPPGDCIPPPPAGLTEVFEAITHHGLWDYFHYSPLVQIAKKFAADDPEMEGWVETYKRDLKAYNLVTTVEEYIETDLEIAGPPSANRAKYNSRYYTPMEWKTKFVDHSLQYLAEVWELFSYHYLVPDSPPSALLDRVRRGCFSMTWLVPSGLIPSLIKRMQLETEFFQQYRIVKVTVGNECVYKETAEESTLEAELVQQKNTPPTNTPRRAEGGAEPHDRPQQEETFGGYDCTFIEPPPSAFQTDCPICSLTLRDPYLTDCCGTHFCHSCSKRLQTEHKPCPTCRKNKFELFPNKSLGRTIRQLHVLCTNGCDWTGELGQLENHLDKVVHCVALYDYEKQEDDELSLKVGDVITVTDVEQIDESGWCEGVIRGERGLFPANYVRYSRAIHSPNPGSFKLKKRAAILSEESEAFRKCSANLIRGIQDPELLAWELYSSNVISKKQVDEASMAGQSAMQRKTRLLSAIGNQIAVDPAKFKILLNVLGKHLPLEDILDKLKSTYRSHLEVGNKGRGQKEAVVLYDHEKDEDDELSGEMGDVITDVEQFDDGWCEGVLNERRGLFPSNYVRFSRDIELQGQAWYHGWISQETAEERLNKVPYQCFLIRENGPNLSLSMKHQGEISHFLIEKGSDGYEIIGTDRKFHTLLQLVDFYMTKSVSGDSRHQLSSPCPRPSPDDAQQSSDTVPPHARDCKSLLLHPHSRLRWRRAADLPLTMSHHHIVRIGSTIYCGGGYTDKISTARLVFQYNPKQDTWSQLPICPTLQFGFTQLDGKLVTVGGRRLDHSIPISDAYAFQDSETWDNSIIPALPTARFYPTAFNYKSTIVVSGGVTQWHTDSKLRIRTNSVEVFQTKMYQWYRAEPLSVGHSGMSCAIVNDTCCIIGGTTCYASRQAYCTSVSNLISRALPPDHPETSSTPQASPSPPTWQVLPDCQLYYSTAAELGGCLLTIGGQIVKSTMGSTAVHMYSPSTNSWVKISSGDLPVPRFSAAATLLDEGEVIFVGGEIKPDTPTKTVFIVSIKQ